MTENSGAVVYNFPEKIIERQRYVNFLSQREPDKIFLAWFIHARTQRLVGVWGHENKDGLLWASFDREGENFSLFKSFCFPSEIDFWDDMKASPDSGITPAMGKYVGVYRNDPPKPEGKVIAFPGCTVFPDLRPAKEPGKEKKEMEKRPPMVFIARPGEVVPQGVPDLRGKLQRDGLILLSYARCYDYKAYSWDETRHHIKKYWLAYWVTVGGKQPRFYKSGNIFTEADAASAVPENYCGDNYKDGGACSWGRVPWIVHAAPELFDISDKVRAINPRPDHIALLRRSGYQADYEHEFKMTEERAKQAAIKKEKAARKKLWKAKALIEQSAMQEG